MKRIAVTGCSGYYGSRLIQYISTVSPQTRILGLDLRLPGPTKVDEFAQIDLRSPDLHSRLADFQPDTIIHLAFIVKSIHDERLMEEVNLAGSRNLLSAASKIRPQRLLAASSATALGAWPENPVPMDDYHPPRALPTYLYARHKAILETLLADFTSEHPEIAVSWTRPCVVCGPHIDNYLSRMYLDQIAVVRPDGCDVPQQFVHEDDLAAATWHILKQGGRGPYNVGPADWMLLSDIARETGRRSVSLPLSVMYAALKICWALRLPFLDYPPASAQFTRYPWVVAPNRLCKELGFQFRYSSLEAFRAMVQAHVQRRTGASQPPKDRQVA
ncbi:MAG: NAD-dependent epimerase/dehydratase family protein [Planctomycetes bacterium]|nr:NAD-dependent epimerase/dehydratase family protein [Planctomycetota bacterium]